MILNIKLVAEAILATINKIEIKNYLNNTGHELEQLKNMLQLNLVVATANVKKAGSIEDLKDVAEELIRTNTNFMNEIVSSAQKEVVIDRCSDILSDYYFNGNPLGITRDNDYRKKIIKLGEERFGMSILSNFLLICAFEESRDLNKTNNEDNDQLNVLKNRIRLLVKQQATAEIIDVLSKKDVFMLIAGEFINFHKYEYNEDIFTEYERLFNYTVVINEITLYQLDSDKYRELFNDKNLNDIELSKSKPE